MWTKDAIREIVESETLVVFAKGTKEAPRCGFSSRAIETLRATGKPFKVIDTLADPTCRPALVSYSDWPTTPQIFVKGELIGGHDILMEMAAEGEFQKQVAEAFGEEYKAPQVEACPVEVTEAARTAVKGFMESPGDLLRLKVDAVNGEAAFSLDLDTRVTMNDTRWAVGDLNVVCSRASRALFDTVRIDWVEKDGGGGFSVKEIGEAPAIPEALEIDGAELKQILDNPPEKLVIVDVREDDEWKSGHAPNAKHLPLSRLEKEWEAAGLAKDAPIIVYCAKGARSLKAVNFLREKGLAKARSLTGGLGSFPAAPVQS